jgi:phage baseplate assembly protein V
MRALEGYAGGADALATALAGLQARLWTALPGVVESFDPITVTAVIAPTIKGVVARPDGQPEVVDLPLLPDVPVVFPRGGGVTLTFPVKPGDECLVVFSSRCIDAWWQSGGSQLAPELRMHDLSDGFALIGPQSQARKIDNIATDSAQLRSDDGAAYIEIHPDTHAVNLVTPGDVNATVAGTVTGQAKAWDITGNVKITGALNVSRGITFGSGGGGDMRGNGSITVTGDVVGGGISLDNHTHSDPQGGHVGKPDG